MTAMEERKWRSNPWIIDISEEQMLQKLWFKIKWKTTFMNWKNAHVCTLKGPTKFQDKNNESKLISKCILVKFLHYMYTF